MADTPPFWKKFGYAGTVLGGTTAYLATNIPVIPKTWLAFMAGISVIMILASALAVDVTKFITTGDYSFEAVANLLPDLQNKFSALHDDVKATMATVQEIKAAPAVPIMPIVNQVVNEAPEIVAKGESVYNEAAASDAIGLSVFK